MTDDSRPVPDAADPAADVHTALATHLADRVRLVGTVDPRIADLSGHLVSFVLDGGKRLRPRFALAGWTCTPGAGPLTAEVVTACAALELIQACALVHDDIVDASDTRRGRPTVHRAVEAGHRDAGWTGDPARYGTSQATLLGDLALSWADDMFLGSGVEPGALRRALEPWSAMKSEVLAGQMLDVLAEASGADDEMTPRRVNRFKTAAYTVERPLHIGAALAGAPAETVGALRRFGVAVGCAFQLRDDLLGVFGDPEITGKPSGDDIREGKRTLLLARGIATASPRDADLLRDVLGTELDAPILNAVRSILRDGGAEAEIESEIAALTGEALDAVSGPEIDPIGRDRLTSLAEAATRRRS